MTLHKQMRQQKGKRKRRRGMFPWCHNSHTLNPSGQASYGQRFLPPANMNASMAPSLHLPRPGAPPRQSNNWGPQSRYPGHSGRLHLRYDPNLIYPHASYTTDSPPDGARWSEDGSSRERDAWPGNGHRGHRGVGGQRFPGDAGQSQRPQGYHRTMSREGLVTSSNLAPRPHTGIFPQSMEYSASSGRPHVPRSNIKIPRSTGSEGMVSLSQQNGQICSAQDDHVSSASETTGRNLSPGKKLSQKASQIINDVLRGGTGKLSAETDKKKSAANKEEGSHPRAAAAAAGVDQGAKLLQEAESLCKALREKRSSAAAISIETSSSTSSMCSASGTRSKIIGECFRIPALPASALSNVHLHGSAGIRPTLKTPRSQLTRLINARSHRERVQLSKLLSNKGQKPRPKLSLPETGNEASGSAMKLDELPEDIINQINQLLREPDEHDDSMSMVVPEMDGDEPWNHEENAQETPASTENPEEAPTIKQERDDSSNRGSFLGDLDMHLEQMLADVIKETLNMTESSMNESQASVSGAAPSSGSPPSTRSGDFSKAASRDIDPVHSSHVKATTPAQSQVYKVPPFALERLITSTAPEQYQCPPDQVGDKYAEALTDLSIKCEPLDSFVVEVDSTSSSPNQSRTPTKQQLADDRDVSSCSSSVHQGEPVSQPAMHGSSPVIPGSPVTDHALAALSPGLTRSKRRRENEQVEAFSLDTPLDISKRPKIWTEIESVGDVIMSSGEEELEKVKVEVDHEDHEQEEEEEEEEEDDHCLAGFSKDADPMEHLLLLSLEEEEIRKKMQQNSEALSELELLLQRTHRQIHRRKQTQIKLSRQEESTRQRRLSLLKGALKERSCANLTGSPGYPVASKGPLSSSSLMSSSATSRRPEPQHTSTPQGLGSHSVSTLDLSAPHAVDLSVSTSERSTLHCATPPVVATAAFDSSVKAGKQESETSERLDVAGDKVDSSSSFKKEKEDGECCIIEDCDPSNCCIISSPTSSAASCSVVSPRADLQSSACPLSSAGETSDGKAKSSHVATRKKSKSFCLGEMAMTSDASPAPEQEPLGVLTQPPVGSATTEGPGQVHYLGTLGAAGIDPGLLKKLAVNLAKLQDARYVFVEEQQFNQSFSDCEVPTAVSSPRGRECDTQYVDSLTSDLVSPGRKTEESLLLDTEVLDSRDDSSMFKRPAEVESSKKQLKTRKKRDQNKQGKRGTSSNSTDEDEAVASGSPQSQEDTPPRRQEGKKNKGKKSDKARLVRQYLHAESSTDVEIEGLERTLSELPSTNTSRNSTLRSAAAAEGIGAIAIAAAAAMANRSSGALTESSSGGGGTPVAVDSFVDTDTMDEGISRRTRSSSESDRGSCGPARSDSHSGSMTKCVPYSKSKCRSGAFELLESHVTSLAILNKWLIVGLHSGSLYRYMRSGCVRPGQFAGHHTGPVMCLHVSKGNPHVISGGLQDCCLMLHNFQSCRQTSIREFGGPVTSFAEGVDLFYVGLADGTVACLNSKVFPALELSGTIKCCTKPVTAVCVVREGNLLLVASQDCSIGVRDASTGQLMRTLEGHTKYPLTMQVCNNKVYSGGADNVVLVHSLIDGEMERMLRFRSRVNCLELSASRVFVGEQRGALHIINTQTSNREKCFYTAKKKPITALAARADMLYMGEQDGGLVGIKLTTRHGQRCQYGQCDLVFGTSDDLSYHLMADHINPVLGKRSRDAAGKKAVALKCLWKGCEETVSATGVKAHMKRHLEKR